jgi:hypothetical protein
MCKRNPHCFTEYPIFYCNCIHMCLCVWNVSSVGKGTVHGMVYDNQITIHSSTDIPEGVASSPSKCVVHNILRRAQVLCTKRVQAPTCPTEMWNTYTRFLMWAAARVMNSTFHSASGGTKNFVYICLQVASSDRAACKEFAMTMPGKLDKDDEFLRKIIFSD